MGHVSLNLLYVELNADINLQKPEAEDPALAPWCTVGRYY